MPSWSARPSCAPTIPARRWPRCSEAEGSGPPAALGTRPRGRLGRRMGQPSVDAFLSSTTGLATRRRSFASAWRPAPSSIRRVRSGRSSSRRLAQGAGRDPGPGPVPRARPGGRAGFFGARPASNCRHRCATSSRSCVAGRMSHCRRTASPGRMGGARRAAAQHQPDGRGWPARQPCQEGLGSADRRSAGGSRARASPCVYMLWGAHAQAKASLIEETAARHGREAMVLQANHPSPLSASRPPVPFLGCGHFGQAREWLAARGYSGVF